MFLVLGIIKCTLATQLFVHKYLTLGNYISHFSTQNKVFSTTTFTQSFYMFRHKASTFPSSWSFFMMPVSTCCDKDRRHSIWQEHSQRRNVMLVYAEAEALPVFFTNLFPLLLCCSCCEPAQWGRQRLCACWSLSPIYRPLLLLCNAACSALREHSLLWIITDSIPFLHKAELFQFDYHEEQQQQCMTEKLRLPLRWLCFTKTTTWQSASVRWKRKHKSWRERDAEL